MASIACESIISDEESVHQEQDNDEEEILDYEFDEAEAKTAAAANSNEKIESEQELADDNIQQQITPQQDVSDREEGEEKSDDGEVNSDDDLEEGEVKEDDDVGSTPLLGVSGQPLLGRKPIQAPNRVNQQNQQQPGNVCRFFGKGQCTWGANCRFLHPMGAVHKRLDFPPQPTMHHQPPQNRRRPPPEYFDGPPQGPGPKLGPSNTNSNSESAWERGLRHAKEMIVRATKRKGL